MTTVAALNDAGDILVFTRAQGQTEWTRTNLSEDLGIASAATNVIVFVDPSTGRASFAATTSDGVLLIEQQSDGSFFVRNLGEIAGAIPIVDSLR